ncbi:Dethiobiotin synthetase [Labilithrix luteola]|uniref:ATP-dependent dethiobiotin synthetase BioD n=1 Tax=Labilithrix luteola TaxID=1391654 RepID=A0A0K1PTB3_9BACT|nr:dethiobiotin synthase [Labilithrix luteola]AKU96773.1 Dethiobiotin synthetase [Labilithrix luteola]
MSRAPLVVVSGTGTEIGKTHLSASLLGAWRRHLERLGHPHALLAGLKPIESGVPEGAAEGADGEILGRLSTFHVKRYRSPYLLVRPVSPHLAARAEGLTLEPEVVLRWVEEIRVQVDGALVELPGGLFSPLGPGLTNADLARELRPDALILIAPDRLGVLHDIATTVRAARGAGLHPAGILLSTPDVHDASTGANAPEVPLVTDVPVLATLPRAPIDELAQSAELAAVIAALLP